MDFDKLPQDGAVLKSPNFIAVRANKQPLGKWKGPENWHTLTDPAIKQAAHIGLVISPLVDTERNRQLVALDFDKTRDRSGVMGPGAMAVMGQLQKATGGTYQERSISGRGDHAFIWVDRDKAASLPPVAVVDLGGKLDPEDKSDGNKLEVWSGNGGARYILLTGREPDGTGTIADGTAFLQELMQRAEVTTKGSRDAVAQAPDAGGAVSADFPTIVIRAIRESAQVFKFSALFDDGDLEPYGGDHSKADQALMNILAFWTCGNAALMKAIFQQSALAGGLESRKKGHVDDYLARTAERAIRDCEAFPDHALCYDWPKYTTDAKGNKRPIRAAYQNMEYVCRQINISFRRNLLTKRIETTRPDLQQLSFDSLLTEMRGICHGNGLLITMRDTEDMIKRIAEKNQYNPIHDYLKACQANYDGGSYIHQLFECFELDPDAEQDVDFSEMLFTRWVLSCVRLAFNTGDYGAQGVLILKGPQGVGKTRFLYTILPQPSWGKDGLTVNPKSKDDVMNAIGFWIVELGEFNETMRKDRADSLKQFFGQHNDTLREPYGRSAQTFARTTAFMGTVNESGILKDDTGERRYWILAVKRVNNEKAPALCQMWGEAMHRAFELKEDTYLTQDEINQLNERNEMFKQITPEEQILLDQLDWEAPERLWQGITASELCERVRLPVGHNGKMAKAIRRMAAKDGRVGVPTRHGSRKDYLLPPFRTEDFLE